MATGGFAAEITVETCPELKRALHGAAYLIAGLTHLSELRLVKARFSGPEFSRDGELLVLGIWNGRQAGGGHVLSPEALADDGLLEVGILPDVPAVNARPCSTDCSTRARSRSGAGRSPPVSRGCS
jgi:diacylglycerol kinase family enzyme